MNWFTHCCNFFELMFILYDSCVFCPLTSMLVSLLAYFMCQRDKKNHNFLFYSVLFECKCYSFRSV